MIRPRARSAGGNRAGGRARAKVTSHRAAPKQTVLAPSQYGRATCPVCREPQPLLANGKLRSHRMYVVPCLGSHESPLTEG